jgi:hypothetical protein
MAVEGYRRRIAQASSVTDLVSIVLRADVVVRA